MATINTVTGNMKTGSRPDCSMESRARTTRPAEVEECRKNKTGTRRVFHEGTERMEETKRPV